MSMTRAEAIDWFEQVRDIAKRNLGEKWTRGCEKHYQLKVDLAEAALIALRGPTREMAERMRGRWVDLDGEEVETDEYGCPSGFASCSVCDDNLTAAEEYSCRGRFCPNCGAPMTDEAVDMMPRRWKEAVSNG